MNYYSSYGPRIEKEKVSRTHAISTESKSEEYLEVEVSTNLTTGVQKTISFKNVYDGKIAIQQWHLILIVVFIACSFLISLSIVFASIRVSATKVQYEDIEKKYAEFREEFAELMYRIEACNSTLLLSRVRN